MHPHDHDLVGYLLDMLDDDARRGVESYLKANPAARASLDRLRIALAPLGADISDPEPPTGLLEATLANLPPGRLPPLPRSPRLPAGSVGGISWWGRADVIAASFLGLLGLGVLWAWLGNTWKTSDTKTCQENLREYHHALVSYAERDDRQAFPRVEPQGSHGFAGVFIPVLLETGHLADGKVPVCPTHGHWVPPQGLENTATLERWFTQDRAQFDRVIAEMAKCYAYSLGYRDEKGLCGLRMGAGMDHLPIMADSPPFSGQIGGNSGGTDNSRTHGGRGQNVLYIDGSVRFVTKRTIGPSRDDIYLNHDRRIHAGLNEADSVLGASDACP